MSVRGGLIDAAIGVGVWLLGVLPLARYAVGWHLIVGFSVICLYGIGRSWQTRGDPV